MGPDVAAIEGDGRGGIDGIVVGAALERAAVNGDGVLALQALGALGGGGEADGAAIDLDRSHHLDGLGAADEAAVHHASAGSPPSSLSARGF